MNENHIKFAIKSTDQDIKQLDQSYTHAMTVLHDRAVALSSELLPQIENDETDIVEFKIDSENYGIESKYVNRVCKAVNITKLPNVPDYVEGIFNMHGKVICVINLKKIFSMTNANTNESKLILIVCHESTILGILIDELSKTSRINMNEIQTSLPTITGVRAELIKGVTKDQLIVLNATNIISNEQMIVNDLV